LFPFFTINDLLSNSRERDGRGGGGRGVKTEIKRKQIEITKKKDFAVKSATLKVLRDLNLPRKIYAT